MDFNLFFPVNVYSLALTLNVVMGGEPVCVSRFDYDFKMVKKLAALEMEIERQATLIQSLDERLANTEMRLDSYEKNTNGLKAEHSTGGSGSTYVRWGRSSCPDNGTELVYKGQAGGSFNDHRGGAAEFLCLPSDPLWGAYDDKTNINSAFVFGTEYQTEQRNTKSFFGRELIENDVPCVVCRTKRANILMIPARNQCYDGWAREYVGYLMSGHYIHNVASQYICMDAHAEVLDKGGASENSKLLYYTEARCGSLRCPPYVNGRELACVVCSV